MITPAISVLSAVEGLHLATPVLTPYVIPHHGADPGRSVRATKPRYRQVGAFWAGHAALVRDPGLVGSDQHDEGPQVLAAFDPEYAMRFSRPTGDTVFWCWARCSW